MNVDFSGVSCTDKNQIPPPSTPRAIGHSPADTSDADPLEEPPAILLVLYGFLAGLQSKQTDMCLLPISSMYIPWYLIQKSPPKMKYNGNLSMTQGALTHNVDLSH